MPKLVYRVVIGSSRELTMVVVRSGNVQIEKE
jgi:hypothetical protein